MNNRQQRTLAMFNRILLELDRALLTTRPPLMQQMRTRLEETITRIGQLQHAQNMARHAVQSKYISGLKTKVRRKQMMPLVKVARPLLRFAPGESALWSVPHARASAKTVGRHGVALAKALKPHAKLLASAGYDKQFMADFERDSKALMQGEQSKDKGRANRSRATRDLVTEFKNGIEAIGILEGMMMDHAADN